MCNWRKLVKMLRESEKNGDISKSLVVRSGAAFKISTFLGDSKLLKHSWTKPQLQASQGKMTNTNTNTNTYSHSSSHILEQSLSYKQVKVKWQLHIHTINQTFLSKASATSKSR